MSRHHKILAVLVCSAVGTAAESAHAASPAYLQLTGAFRGPRSHRLVRRLLCWHGIRWPGLRAGPLRELPD